MQKCICKANEPLHSRKKCAQYRVANYHWIKEDIPVVIESNPSY
jgi:hypothetical protein